MKLGKKGMITIIALTVLTATTMGAMFTFLFKVDSEVTVQSSLLICDDADMDETYNAWRDMGEDQIDFDITVLTGDSISFNFQAKTAVGAGEKTIRLKIYESLEDGLNITVLRNTEELYDDDVLTLSEIPSTFTYTVSVSTLTIPGVYTDCGIEFTEV